MEAKVFTYKDGYITEKPSDITLGYFENYQLKSYAYPIKLENGTELVEGKDFELWTKLKEIDDKEIYEYEAIPLTPAPKMSKEDAAGRIMLEKEVDALKRHIADINYIAEQPGGYHP